MPPLNSFLIREAENSDLPLLAEIERAADTQFPEGRLPAGDTTFPVESLKAAISNQLLFVAEDDQMVVGFAVCAVVEQAMHLHLLAVHPTCGRRGIGSRLVRHVIEISRQHGLIGATLTTFSDIPWNAPFYSRLGFRILAHTERNSALNSILSTEAAAGMQSRVAMFHDLTG